MMEEVRKEHTYESSKKHEKDWNKEVMSLAPPLVQRGKNYMNTTLWYTTDYLPLLTKTP